MHRIPSSASHYQNISMSSRRSTDVTSFSGRNAREPILKERSDTGERRRLMSVLLTTGTLTTADSPCARHQFIRTILVLAWPASLQCLRLFLKSQLTNIRRWERWQKSTVICKWHGETVDWTTPPLKMKTNQNMPPRWRKWKRKKFTLHSPFLRCQTLDVCKISYEH